MKKIPMRLCLATNESFPKKDMFRVVRTPEGEVKLDFSGKANGRGADISKSKNAIEIAKAKKVLEKKLEIEIPSSIFEEMEKSIS